MKHFVIFQADSSTPEGAKILFRSYSDIQEEGTTLTLNAYKKVYEGDFEEQTDSELPVTEQLYMMFNVSRPRDFKGHSLSVSDIIVIDGHQYFCDDLGFKLVSIPAEEPKKEEELQTMVTRILEEGKLFAEVDATPDGEIIVLIEWGDWKHEHGYLRCLMQQNGFTETAENVTEENGSDCYSAIHIFKKTA